jgi:hypothetical protein
MELKPIQVSKSRFRSPASYFALSAPSEVGASSIIGNSVFSHLIANFLSTPRTSILDVDRLVTKPRIVPKPPIVLEPGCSFLCPYYLDEIEVSLSIITKDN